MATPSEPRAAGAIIAITTLSGAILGAVQRQPTIGLLAGFAIGAIAAVLFWLKDRRS